MIMENMTYAQAVERLEEIMTSIQGGGMDVDKLAVTLKEADALVKFCRSKLFEVDEEVKLLLDELSADV